MGKIVIEDYEEILQKMRSLEKELTSLKKILSIKRKKCKHNIIVCLGNERRCLLCRENVDICDNECKNAFEIHIENYKNKIGYTNEAKFKMVRGYVQDLLSEEPNIDEEKLAKKVSEHFQIENSQFEKINTEINKIRINFLP